MSVVANERIKLTATWLNGISITIFAVGGLGPTFATIYGSGNPIGFVSLVIVVCVVIAIGPRVPGRRILRGLQG